MAFLFSFEASICLPQTYGNSEWAAEPNDLNDGVGIRQWLLSLARLCFLSEEVRPPTPIWGTTMVASYPNVYTVWYSLKWFSCPRWVITGVCKVKSWNFIFFSLYKNNFFFFFQASKSEFLNYSINPLMPIKSSEWYQTKALEIPSPALGHPIYTHTCQRMLQIEASSKYLLSEGVNELCKYGP